MLSPSDLALIVLTTLVCTAAVTLLATLALRLNRRGSVASQFAIVVAAAVAAIACSTIAVVVEMLFDAHDLIVLAWVIGVSAVASLAAAWLITSRIVRASTLQLVESAQRIGEGAVVDAHATGWREFNDLAAELALTSQRLAAARAEIDKLDAARRQFFVWISHDLRTPLTGMRAMAEALEDQVVDDPIDYIRAIRAKVDTVDRMVDDLFELSRLETGTLRLHRELVVLFDLVSDAVVDVRAIAATRDIRIVQAGIDGHTLWADPRELTRAIGNLLSNGIRHAPDGSEILISAHTRDDAHLVVSVLDHGSGVVTEDLGRMFDVGWRADTARSSGDGSAQGAGLGLAIVRGIIEAHGGDVRALPVEGGFRLDLILPTAAP